MKRRHLIAGIIAILVVWPVPLSAQVVVNGSFEAVVLSSPFFTTSPSDVPGWTKTGALGDAQLFAVGYADGGGSVTIAGQGNQFAVLGGGAGGGALSAWKQTVTGLTPGVSYTLDFKLASEINFAQDATVSFLTGSTTAGQNFTTAPASVNYWHDWEQKTLTFVASGTSATIQWAYSGPFDLGLDDIVITAIPEPATGLLLALSLALSGLTARRGRFARRR